MHWSRETQPETGAHVLGLASVGIGLTELLAPRFVERLLGLEDRPRYRGVLQTLGVRELMHGVGLLTADHDEDRKASGVWARVAGDVLDTALLAGAATKTSRPASFAAVAASVAAIGVADLSCALQTSHGQHHWY